MGLDRGLAALARVREVSGLPVVTDVHDPSQVPAVAAVVDAIQVPALLARQTDLLLACGRTNKWVEIKKGQFMSPQEMANAVEKIRSSPRPDGRPSQVLLTERGTFFGYNRLVNDFTGLAVMKQFGCPVIFDVTHSTQQPAGHAARETARAPVMGRRSARGCLARAVLVRLAQRQGPDERLGGQRPPKTDREPAQHCS